ncbi:chloride channel protein [Bifidobacterium sp. 64T4]|uniref:chloride channel protein n=1 Tax=Bifidobacterium pongonis TaxID=2834432 RepID=UPI001C57072A|nr:chloride channel protein [Bifidobacterium pongonis]MBW3094093.1 chloride channel protein [Bifidobacterium pongonis]
MAAMERANAKEEALAAQGKGDDDTPRFGRLASLIVAVAVIGVLIGVAAGLLTLMLYGVEHVALGYVEDDGEPGPFNVPALRRAISVVVGLSIAAVAWWLLRTRAQRVPSVKKAVNGEHMPAWQTVVHVLLQIFIVGTGASVGREVAPRELGALFGQRFARWVRLGPRDTRMLVAITAAAGLAGVYNAPLAGTFFATEILLADISLETVSLAFGCSALASWAASLVKGTHVFYNIGHVDGLFTSDLIGFALLAGLVCGVCGSLFRRGSSWAEKQQSSGTSILWTLPLAGVLTGVVSIWVPQVMGNGRATAQLSFSGKAGLALIPVLLISFAAKAIVTLLTIRAGASGGVLQPGIALGASMGATLGVLWMMGFHTNSLGVYALIGACALLSASQHAPLMAMCLVMELADAPLNLFVPVGCAVAVAGLASNTLSPKLAAWHPLESLRTA